MITQKFLNEQGLYFRSEIDIEYLNFTYCTIGENGDAVVINYEDVMALVEALAQFIKDVEDQDNGKTEEESKEDIPF